MGITVHWPASFPGFSSQSVISEHWQRPGQQGETGRRRGGNHHSQHMQTSQIRVGASPVCEEDPDLDQTFTSPSSNASIQHLDDYTGCPVQQFCCIPPGYFSRRSFCIGPRLQLLLFFCSVAVLPFLLLHYTYYMSQVESWVTWEGILRHLTKNPKGSLSSLTPNQR